jgi:Zn-dependent protease
MFGSLSLKIGSAFGIPVRLHWTFLILIYLVLVNDAAPMPVAALSIVLLFGSVLLHELGHSLVARRFGIRVIDITFWPLGGMARMAEMPESARVEGLVALAGPAVNFVLALLALCLWALLPEEAARALLHYFIWINLAMGVFNLIPAFPMDGGRILRALLALSHDWLAATERAVSVGRSIASLLFLGSILVAFRHPGYLGFTLVGAFVWLAGGRELMAVRLRHAGWSRGPREPAIPYHSASPAPAQARVEAEPGGARRPRMWEFPSVASFGEDAIRELEHYRGRLRRRVDEETG